MVVVAINGKAMDSFRFPCDEVSTRCGNRGGYHEVVVPFDVLKLTVGAKKITLSLGSIPPEGIVKCAVMCDAIRPELDPSADPPSE